MNIDTPFGAQLAFAFQRQGGFAAASFVDAASNAEARLWLAQDKWPDGRLWIWGGEGTGKTHLLSIWAARGGARMLAACDLDERMVADLLETPDLPGVAIDDADRLPSGARAMLHLVNGLRERRVPLLLAGRLPPGRVAIDPPDLASRLRACASVCIGPADDRLLSALLMRLLAERDIVVPRPVLDWLHRHLPRSPAALVRAVERLDRAGLAAGRPITRSLAREVLTHKAVE